METKIKKITSVLLLAIMIIAMASVPVLATTNEKVILKNSNNEYLIYFKEFCKKDFQFAISKNDKAVETELNFVNSAKDQPASSGEALNVAYIDETSFEGIFGKNPTSLVAYIWVKDADDKTVIKAEKIDLSDALTEKMIAVVNTTTKANESTDRIAIDTTQEQVTNPVVEGITTTVRTGKIVVKEKKDSKYYYSLIKVSDENNNKINIDSENDNIVPEKTTVKNEENANAGNNKEFNTDRESKSELYLNENGMESIVSNLKNTITDNILTEDGIADKIIKQITDDIRLYAKADTTALEIQLEPETLGKVGITVTSKAGTITAQLVVQNEVAKEAIESQMATLKESFASQDIKVDAVEVTIASKEFEQNLDKGAGNSSEQNENKRRKHISTEELAEINGTATDKETSIDNVLKEMGTTVNYSV